MAKSKRPTKKGRSSDDLFLAVLETDNREAFVRIVNEEALFVEHTKQLEDKVLEAELLLTRDKIKRLESKGWSLKVHQNLSEIGRARQKEVAKGDRFKGGTVAPKGLGIKTREED